ncbi:hypothetical protein [Mucisphaera calidilacus]|uniref:DUF3108 domain-containing protein n=1 Tax=Mucisphaera calidilacus TaxID=2527982 RepID=A0A518C127_9BACT|nr:hypothetical protein [Mucisphaera calidilacus]QDU72922.1 hypothetical protein Pan265_27980 [Mucisphaera calidilacus]
MMRRWTAMAALVLLVLASPGFGQLSELNRAWADDPIWHDGLCEIATYEAERVIYGQPRTYTARLFTNKERYDAKSTTKASSGGVEVFKHHRRDDVPTRNYTYHFSTMAYVDTRTLGPVKLEMGSQEDCGATFKQFVLDRGTLRTMQSSYFPGEGLREGRHSLDDERAAFVDALTLTLRGFPFGGGRSLVLRALPPQIDTHLTPDDPMRVMVRELDIDELDLPIGRVRAHHLVVEMEESVGGSRRLEYWFAERLEGAGDEAGRHVLVQHAGPWGVRMRLASIERRAYWK